MKYPLPDLRPLNPDAIISSNTVIDPPPIRGPRALKCAN